MKATIKKTILNPFLIIYICLTTQCVSQTNIGVNLGLFIQPLTVTTSESTNRNKPMGTTISARLTQPISKKIKELCLQFDISYRFLNFRTINETIGQIELRDNSIGLSPVISRFFGIGNNWSPLIKFGFDTNLALKRTIKDIKITGIRNLLSSNILLGTGITHKGGFSVDVSTTYGLIIPENSINGTRVEWFPLGFILNIGYFFNKREQ